MEPDLHSQLEIVDFEDCVCEAFVLERFCEYLEGLKSYVRSHMTLKTLLHFFEFHF